MRINIFKVTYSLHFQKDSEKKHFLVSNHNLFLFVHIIIYSRIILFDFIFNQKIYIIVLNV